MTEVIIKRDENGRASPVQELVRCKDCIYCTRPLDGCSITICKNMPTFFPTNDNWFCANGVKK